MIAHRPTCKVCGDNLEGDGYKTVIHCPNIDGIRYREMVAYAAPDAGPFYCDKEAQIERLSLELDELESSLEWTAMKTTNLTPTQRREDAEQRCLEQMHTTMQCMHLPIKLTLYGASNTTVEEAFESVVTLMRCHLYGFRQELAAIESKKAGG